MKNIFKKIIAIVISSLLISNLFINVSAETAKDGKLLLGFDIETKNSYTSDTGDVIDKGEEVVLNVKIKENIGISFLRMKVTFDSNKFEYKGYKTNNIFNCSENFQDKSSKGYIIYTLNLNTKIDNSTGNIFSIKFLNKCLTCSNAEFDAALIQNSPGNCIQSFANPASTIHIPFVTDPLNIQIHNFDKNSGTRIEPDCYNEGYTEYTCKDCGEKIKGNFVSQNHSFINGICDKCGSRQNIIDGFSPVDKPVLNSDKKYVYGFLNHENLNAEKITVSFPKGIDTQSEMSYINVYDENDNLLEKFQLRDLKYSYINVKGKKVKLQLVSDSPDLTYNAEFVDQFKFAKGDIDGDFELNSKDLVLLKKILIGLSAREFEVKNSDVNGNGKKDILDLVIVKKIISNN